MNLSEAVSKCDSSSNFRLLGCVISFEPHDSDSVDSLLSKFGPEGLYEIADILKKAADDDMSQAYHDSISEDI